MHILHCTTISFELIHNVTLPVCVLSKLKQLKLIYLFRSKCSYQNGISMNEQAGGLALSW